MKRKLMVFLVLIIAVLGVLIYTGKIKIVPKLKVVAGSENHITVRVPIGEHCVDVYIDGDNELQQTNESTIWKFTNASIYVTQAKPTGHRYSDDISFKGDMIWKKYNNYYVCVKEEQHRLGCTIDSFNENEPTDNSYVLSEDHALDAIPAYSNPETYDSKENSVICPVGSDDNMYDKWLNKAMESVTPDTDNNAITHYDSNGYYNCSLTYGNYTDILDKGVSRIVELSQNVDIIWFMQEDSAYIESGDRYLGIRKVNLNTFVVVTGRGEQYKDYVLATTFGLK